MSRSDSSVVAPLIIILLLLLGDTNCDGRGRRLLRRPDLTVTGSAASSSSGVREGEAARATCLPMLPSGDGGTGFASCSWVDPSGEVIVASKEDYRRNRSRCSLFKLITYECSTERCFFYFLTKEKKRKKVCILLAFSSISSLRRSAHLDGSSCRLSISSFEPASDAGYWTCRVETTRSRRGEGEKRPFFLEVIGSMQLLRSILVGTMMFVLRLDVFSFVLPVL